MVADPQAQSKITTKALLAILNNGKAINDKAALPIIVYSNKEFLILSHNEGDNHKNKGNKKEETKRKGKKKKEAEYSAGLPMKTIISSVHGKFKNHNLTMYNNLIRRLNTLEKLNIIERKGTARPYKYALKTDVNSFKAIIQFLLKENQIRKLIYTDYFNKDGIKNFQILFNKLPEGFLDIDINNPEQVSKFGELIYGRLMRSPTFLSLLVSDNLNERLTALQESLYASYIRQEGVKNNFPFLQLLGDYCLIIDYLNGRAVVSQNELTECLNDTERLIHSMWKDKPELPNLVKLKKKSKNTRRKRTDPEKEFEN